MIRLGSSAHNSGLILLLVAWLHPAGAGAGHLTAGWLHSAAHLAPLIQRDGADPGARKEGTWLVAGGSLLYGLADLPVRFLAAGATRKLGSGRGWARVNRETVGNWPVQESSWGAEVAWEGRFGFGWLVEGRGGSVDGQSLPQSLWWGWHGFQSLHWGDESTLTGEVFWSPRGNGAAGNAATGPRPLVSVVLASGPRSLAVAVDRGRDGRPRTGVELALGNGKGLAMTWGLDAVSGAMGPGICAARGPVLVLTSHRVHPVLGVTHRIMVILGRWQNCRL